MLRLLEKKNKGMRSFLEEVEKEKTVINQGRKDIRRMRYGPKVVEKKEHDDSEDRGGPLLNDSLGRD